jgi:hypothetical protein
VWESADVVSVHLQMLGFPVSPATVRKWGSRGHIRAHGPRGARYDLVTAQAWAQSRDQREWHLS